jgi:D-sedoheptulose 7-phosphate isomerase
MDYLQQLIERYPVLEPVKKNINDARQILINCFSNKGKLLVAGNGGSAADSEHIVGELMKNFVLKRKLPDTYITALKNIDNETGNFLETRLQPCLPAISLSGHLSLSTACINDIGGDVTFAQQVYGYGNPGDVFLGISTSGSAKNVLCAAVAAKAKGLSVIALSGGSGGKLAKYADVSIVVPETETYKIQELHLPIYHTLCLTLEEHFFS